MVRGRVLRSFGASAVVAASVLVAAVVTSAPARAAGPGSWVQVSSGRGVGNIVDPSVHRFGTALQVVWTQGSGTQTALRTRVLAANGSTASAIRTVLSWGSLDEFPAIFGLGSTRVIVFSGIQDTNTSNPYSVGDNYYATSSDGLSWTLASGTIGSGSAYGSYGSDATNAGGSPLAVYTNGTSNDISFNDGFDPLPPSGPDPHTTHITKCCAYYAGVGYDSGSHQAWTAWYSNSGQAGTDGIDAQSILPALGTRVHAPGSTTHFAGSISSIDPSQRVQVAARRGGGLYTAYQVGYPSPQKVAMWRLGAGAAVVLRDGRGVSRPGVAAAPGGRMWLFWWEPSTSTLRAVRTNKGATKFGRVCSIHTPHNTTEVWKTAGEASNGRLDLVVNAGTGSGEQIYATQVLPCLTGRVSPTKISKSTGGTVTITVSDAGTPVVGAAVSFHGVVKKTTGNGKASFRVASGTAKGIHTISFRHAGYTGGAATFRVIA